MGPKTDCQERRQKKKDDRQASGKPYMTEPPQDLSHQLKVTWPARLTAYPQGWLDEWKEVAKDMCLSLRYSSHRHSAWRDRLDQVSAMSEFTIIGTPGEPSSRARAVHLVSDLVKDSQRLHVTVDLDWEAIVSMWAGAEDRAFNILSSAETYQPVAILA